MFPATVFFIGYSPFAPGTLGTLAAFAFVWFFKLSNVNLFITLLIGFALGVLSAHYAEKALGEKDSRHIVIDEFVGYISAVIFLPATTGYLIAGFVLFRFFDILKPPPIRNIEKAVGGGLGVMLDDLAAGFITNILLQAWNRI